MSDDTLTRYAAGCHEIVTWWDTGILPDGMIRSRAGSPAAPWASTDGYSPRHAEQEFINGLVRHVARLSTPEPTPQDNAEIVERALSQVQAAHQSYSDRQDARDEQILDAIRSLSSSRGEVR